MNARSRFTHGRGCYTCVSCGKRTRTVDQNASTELCELCAIREGVRNTLNDHSVPDFETWHAALEAATTEDQCYAVQTRFFPYDQKGPDHV